MTTWLSPNAAVLGAFFNRFSPPFPNRHVRYFTARAPELMYPNGIATRLRTSVPGRETSCQPTMTSPLRGQYFGVLTYINAKIVQTIVLASVVVVKHHHELLCLRLHMNVDDRRCTLEG